MGENAFSLRTTVYSIWKRLRPKFCLWQKITKIQGRPSDDQKITRITRTLLFLYHPFFIPKYLVSELGFRFRLDHINLLVLVRLLFIPLIMVMMMVVMMMAVMVMVISGK